MMFGVLVSSYIVCSVGRKVSQCGLVSDVSISQIWMMSFRYFDSHRRFSVCGMPLDPVGFKIATNLNENSL